MSTVLDNGLRDALKKGTLWRASPAASAAGPGAIRELNGGAAPAAEAARDIGAVSAAEASRDVGARSVPRRRLLVFVQGLSGYRFRSAGAERYEAALRSLVEDASSPLFGADLLAIPYENGCLARTTPDDVAAKIDEVIAGVANAYDEILLHAHSAGTLFARAAMVRAKESESRNGVSWLSKLERSVFTAATHRGYIMQPNNLFGKLVYWPILMVFDLLNLWGLAAWLKVLQLQTGVMREGAWVNNLRLHWHWAFTASPGRSPDVIHLVGEQDELVNPDDEDEPFRYPNTRKMVRISGTTHAAWIDPTRHARQALQHAFATALGPSDGDDAALQAPAPPTPAAEGVSPARDGDTRLAFLVHGIRDYGEWQTAIADELQDRSPDLRVIKVRYGYFSAFQFAVTDLRQQSVRAFRLQYLEEVLGSRTPLRGDQIAAMGHSNGTYAIGQFVRTHPAARFGRLLLAASVLPKRFPFDGERTPLVRAECAPDDIPVGVLANGLSWYFFAARTIGNAGFAGFRYPKGVDGRNSFHPGDHGQIFRQPGAAGRIAAFLNGADWPANPPRFTWYSWLLHVISFLIVPLVVVGFCWWLFMCLTTWGLATLLTGLVAFLATLILIKM